ncbi:MAG: exodeoxyribonuclease III [Bacillota bacterium]
MKFVSWNTNGLRAARKKGFDDVFASFDADIFAIQETKMQENQKDFSFDGYFEYWNSALKKGYSGTLVYTRHEPLNVTYGIDGKYNDEGRLITLEYEAFYFVTVYTPNAQEELKRLPYRMDFEEDFRAYLKRLDTKKPVVLCGDLNVAHEEIDLKNPSSNRKNAGFSDEEREKFTLLLDEGFKDTFRTLYPDTIKYSWWTYRFGARKRNAGWRIDYFVVSERIMDKVVDSEIHDTIHGSDHCPVSLTIDL